LHRNENTKDTSNSSLLLKDTDKKSKREAALTSGKNIRNSFLSKIRVENVLNTSNIPQIDGNSVKQEGDVENV